MAGRESADDFHYRKHLSLSFLYRNLTEKVPQFLRANIERKLHGRITSLCHLEKLVDGKEIWMEFIHLKNTFVANGSFFV